jgi:hypothetical protein
MTVDKGGVSPAKGSSGWALQLRSKQWVQSSGSMADKAIERIYVTNLLFGSANVKWVIESGNNGFL